MGSTTSTVAALTIGGSDSGGSAGVQADLLSFAANGVYGTTAVTCLTAQNPNGVSAIQLSPPEFVDSQITRVLEYFPVGSIKTGLLLDREIILIVSKRLERHPMIPLVVDPVCVGSDGRVLLKDDAIEALKRRLLPLATVTTPNLDEAELLLGREIKGEPDLRQAALDLAATYEATTLVKGGHLQGDSIMDAIATPEGEVKVLCQKRIHPMDTHGSGCTLSSATAAHLALGRTPRKALSIARDYLRRGMENPIKFPQSPFINHLP